MNNNYKAGIILLGFAGFLYTFERFTAKIIWVIQVASVKINGSGSYQTSPELPSIYSNIFVLVFTIMGTVCFIIGCISIFLIRRENQK